MAEGPRCLFGTPNHREVEWVADILDVPRVLLLVYVKVVNCEQNSLRMKLNRDQTHNPLN